METLWAGNMKMGPSAYGTKETSGYCLVNQYPKLNMRDENNQDTQNKFFFFLDKKLLYNHFKNKFILMLLYLYFKSNMFMFLKHVQ